MSQWGTALRLFIILALITGVLYPLAMTLAGNVLMPEQASGSLIMANGTLVGSSLIEQTPFQVDENGQIVNLDAIAGYFWGRPSAMNAMLGSTTHALGTSGGSNLGPTSATLQAQVAVRESAFRAANHVPDGVAVPTDMLFASASGLDPHISPEAAYLQAERVAEARSLPPAAVVSLVSQHVEQPWLTVFGKPRVNVLALNLALDELAASGG
ncbi:MAG: potassium-transporting ATPase subunit KdpC [Anaerolineae bacterium]